MPVSYRDLEVWQLSKQLVADVYRLSSHFPREEIYGLTSQIRRAAISVPLNIAEGNSRRTTKEYVNFLAIARGSAEEVSTCLELAIDLEFAENIGVINGEYQRVSKMLYGMIRKLST